LQPTESRPRFFAGVSLEGAGKIPEAIEQYRAALALLHAGLSEKGYTKAETIRKLEAVLRELEGRSGSARDPDLYFFTFFGEPAANGAWGWRYEGHHCSQNWTILNGRSIGSSPQFFGANPAEVREGPMKGTRALSAEEDLGRALVKSLSAEQRAEGVLSATAPRDILTSNQRKAAIQEDKGVAYSKLSKDQQGTLLARVPGRTTARGGAPASGEDSPGRLRPHQIRLDGRIGERSGPLLSRARQHVSRGVRQHAGRRQPHSLRVARLPRRLGARPARGALPELPASSTRKPARESALKPPLKRDNRGREL
jgi:hypothetical protein